MADGGTLLTSSSSKDAGQQETFEHSVDQDTPAQGVYIYIYIYIYISPYIYLPTYISLHIYLPTYSDHTLTIL